MPDAGKLPAPLEAPSALCFPVLSTAVLSPPPDCGFPQQKLSMRTLLLSGNCILPPVLLY